MYSRKIILLNFVLLITAGFFLAQSDVLAQRNSESLSIPNVVVEREGIEMVRNENTLTVSIPLRNLEEKQIIGDLIVSLLDEKYRSLAKAEKKVILLNGEQKETIALPISSRTPDLKECILRIDFMDHTWLKRSTEAKNDQELHVIGQTNWVSGSQAALRIVVTESIGGKPIQDAKIRITAVSQTAAEPELLAEAESDENGTADLSFKVPEVLSGQCSIQIYVDSELGSDTLESQINIIPASKILLTTDKPVYQPGQLIRIRALAAHKATGVPIGNEQITLEAYDGKGNKVFKKIETTSEFGIASADFQLADEVNQGDYKIKAILEEDTSEKTVQVFEYVLPKFKVTVENEKKFYAPGDEVKGSVEARYFFGKPVDNAKVTIIANCFDVGFNEFAKVEQKTDDDGKCEYTFTIPDHLVGQPLFKGNTIVQMDVRVLDTADHEEQKFHTFHVATDPIQVEVVPESGKLIDGVENEVYLIASRPDGSVAKPKLTVSSKYLEKDADLTCDENGIAVMTLKPDTDSPVNPNLPVIRVQAEDEGKTITIDKDIPQSGNLERILLRPDKGVYTVGQNMQLTVFSPLEKETVFLDVIKNNQTVLTKTIRLEEGKASLSLPMDNLLAGTLALNAYIIRSDGNMIRDTRQVIVTRSDDLQIEITPDQVEYEPGEAATLKIAVRNQEGEPVRAALGMHIVDESVYALLEKEPGLAKVFFAIERELLEPKVEIHGYQLDQVVRLSAKKFEKDPKLSKALLSKLDTRSEFSLNLDTVTEKRNRVMQDLQQLQSVLGNQALTVSPAIPRSVEEVLLSIDADPASFPISDPWGNPYEITMAENNVMLASLGRDGKLNTADDIKIPNYTFGFRFKDMDGDIVRFKSSTKRGATIIAGNFVESANKSGLVYDGREIANWYFAEPNQPPMRFGRQAGRELRRFEGLRQRGRAPRLLLEKGVAAWNKKAELKAARPAERPPAPDMDAAGAMRFNEAAGQPAAGGMGGMGMMGGMGGKMEGDMGMGMGGGGYGMMGGAPPANQPQMQVQSAPAPMDQRHNLYFSNSDSAKRVDGEDRRTVAADFSDYVESQERELDWDEYAKPELQEPLAINGVVDKEQVRRLAEEELKDIELQLEQVTDKPLLPPLKPDADQTFPAQKENERAVRVRRFFPETLFYTPELITDNNGMIALNLPGADSITTWRMSAMANTKTGAVGDTTAAMKVFKPFFIDLDLPIALTQNDEVTIPVAVYNYLAVPQDVEVQLEQSPWFELLEGEFSRKVHIAANEVTSVSYRIRAKTLGKQPITVYGWGSEDNDAIGREIDVRPNGDAKFVNHNGRLEGMVSETLTFPQERIAGADKLFVKIYPGVFSQVVEGLDAILKMPYGCFEQTSSTTYPNILVLNYMQETDRVTPAIEMKAREYINLGYQRLLTFEIDGGGFQVFGNPPATRILSAYGLMEFMDMNEVYPIDEKLIERTKNWLLGQMNPDGSWDPDQNYAHAEMWRSIQDNKVLSTAYIALALAKTGLKSELLKTEEYLRGHVGEAKDAYTLAILCNAFLALAPEHPTTKRCVGKLVDMGILEGKNLYWKSEASMSFARGNHAWVETTAWAALALIEDGRYSAELGKAINWLIEQKDPNGTWGTTHGTVLALKVMVESIGKRTDKVDAVVTVKVNGEEAEQIKITPEYSDIFRQIDTTNFLQQGDNRVVIELNGEGSLLYQVVGKYFVPWKERKRADVPEGFDISVEYDRSELRRNDTVTCQVKAKNVRRQRVEMVMIDLGIPPGFRVERPALDDYVDKGVIAKYTIMSRQLLIYIESMDGGQELELNIPMKATLPMVAKAPESKIYEYYNPEIQEISEPQELQVN